VARQRFVAPARGEVPAARFDAPLFAAFAGHAGWLSGAGWPTIDAMNRALGAARHPHSGVALRFAEQTNALLADGLHYEQRIHDEGAIATRRENWHDLFNALMWLERLPLKAALNARQAADVQRAGRERTRAQCAQTHFDEAGAIVVLADPGLLDAWDAHDWVRLFHAQEAAWRDGRARVIVFGHALLEHALQPEPVHTAKCIAVLSTQGDREVIDGVACGIVEGNLLADPQDLRPLPLSGIPGWHPATGDAAFYATADCFRPVRPGRVYPSPFVVGPWP
jgi:hypothetical protein